MDQRCNKSTIPIRNLENFLRVIPPLSDADYDSNLLEKKYSVNAANFARSLPLPEQQRNEMQNRQVNAPSLTLCEAESQLVNRERFILQ